MNTAQFSPKFLQALGMSFTMAALATLTACGPTSETDEGVNLPQSGDELDARTMSPDKLGDEPQNEELSPETSTPANLCDGGLHHNGATEVIVDPTFIIQLNPRLSPDGTMVAFNTDKPLVEDDGDTLRDIYLHNFETGETSLLASTSGGSGPKDVVLLGQFSGDGRYLFFSSGVSNLTQADTNENFDVFRYHLATGAMDLVSAGPDGFQDPERDVFSGEDCTFLSVSADGNLVVFESDIDVDDPVNPGRRDHAFLKNMTTGEVELINVDENGNYLWGGNLGSTSAAISGDGRKIAFFGQVVDPYPPETVDEVEEIAGALLGDVSDIFLKDTTTGAVEQITAQSEGLWPNLQLSHDGSLIIVRNLSGQIYFQGGEATSEYVPAFPEELDAFAAVDVWMSPDASHLAGRILGYFLSDSDHCEDEVFVSEGLEAEVRMIRGTNGAEYPQLSSDGSTLIFVDKTADGEHLAIYKMDLD